MVFVAVWTILVLIYLGLAPRFFSSIAHVHAILALDALTMLFWFAGFIALAVWYHDFVNAANFELFAGCAALGDYCGVLEAAVVFGAFEWYVLFRGGDNPAKQTKEAFGYVRLEQFSPSRSPLADVSVWLRILTVIFL